MEKKLKASQELISKMLMGQTGAIQEIAEKVKVSTQTVRNALNREDVSKLTDTELEVLRVASHYAKKIEGEREKYIADRRKCIEEIINVLK